jgi:hypothetical protein
MSRRLPRRTIPTRLAALAVGVPEATIRQWARRGKLTRHGNSSRAEYDVDELLAIAESRAARISHHTG